MSGRKTYSAIYLCGGDYSRVERREDCPNSLHDWPLPAGYVDAHEVAEARMRYRWSNRKCPDCGLYGWAPGLQKPSTNPVRVALEVHAAEGGASR